MLTLVIPRSTLLLHQQTKLEIVIHHQLITLALNSTIHGYTSLYHSIVIMTHPLIHHTMVIMTRPLILHTMVIMTLVSSQTHTHTIPLKSAISEIVIEKSLNINHIGLGRQYIRDLRHTTHHSQPTAHLHPLTKVSPSSTASKHHLAPHTPTQQHLTIIITTQIQILSAISLSLKAKSNKSMLKSTQHTMLRTTFKVTRPMATIAGENFVFLNYFSHTIYFQQF